MMYELIGVVFMILLALLVLFLLCMGVGSLMGVAAAAFISTRDYMLRKENR